MTLEQGGLEQALGAVARQAGRQGGFETEIEIDRSALDLHDEVLLAVARELLTNAARHADASRVTVKLSRSSYALELEVADDGHGMEPGRREAALAQGHIGLASVAQRVQSAGGSFALESSSRGRSGALGCRSSRRGRRAGERSLGQGRLGQRLGLGRRWRRRRRRGVHGRCRLDLDRRGARRRLRRCSGLGDRSGRGRLGDRDRARAGAAVAGAGARRALATGGGADDALVKLIGDRGRRRCGGLARLLGRLRGSLSAGGQRSRSAPSTGVAVSLTLAVAVAGWV